MSSKYQPYPTYKPSGVEWLGNVPEHWQMVRIKTAVQLADRKVEADEDNPLPYIGMENIESKSGRLLPIDPDVIPAGTANAFKKGHTLFGKLRPYLAKACNPQFDGLCSTELLVLDPIKLDSRSLLYSLLCNGFIDLVNSSTYGSKMPRASWDFIGDCALPIASKQEQIAIANFLDRETGKIDTLVNKQRELVVFLEEKRRALISRCVTRGLPPEAAKAAGLNPHPKLKPSGVDWIGDVPEGWKVIPLGYLITIQGGSTPNTSNEEYWDGEVPWVSPKDMKRPLISDSIDHVTPIAVKETGIRMIKRDAVLVVIRGMILAHTFPVGITVTPVTINQDMKALFSSSRLSPQFLFWKLTGLSDVFVSLANESAHGTRKIDTETITRFSFSFPSMEEQTAVSDYLNIETSHLDGLITKVNLAIERLQEYRTALITAAVTGKIDVRNFTEQEAVK